MHVFGLNRSVLTSLVILTALAFVSPALAHQPETQTFNFTVTDNLLQSCDGFNIIENAVIQIKETDFFDQEGKKYSHVGIYLGDGRFVHAPSSGGKVRIDSLEAAYWSRHFVEARRI